MANVNFLTLFNSYRLHLCVKNENGYMNLKLDNNQTEYMLHKKNDDLSSLHEHVR